MARRLALDIGATTVTARLRGGHGARATVLFDGSASVPAAVCFDGDGACSGEAAIAAGAGDPASFAGSPLTAVLTGRLRYGGVERDPAELIMPVLSLVLGHAGDIDPDPPEQMACVVPLGASARLRGPMAAAAQSLGLPEPSLIPEPVAAVLHATGGGGLPPGGTGVVIDAGGSSMEVTVMRGTASGAPEILADRSDPRVGGDDVDARILAWLGSVLDRDNPPLAAALRAETNRTLLASLRAEVRRAKEDLAHLPETDIAVTTLHGHGSVRLTRADLDRILADWSARARGLVAAALSDAGLPANGSVGCFVIGGGASLPTLRGALAPVGRLTVAHEPLVAAADGAAIADDAVLAAIATMDEAPRGPVAKPSRKKALGGAPTPPAAPGRQSPFSAPTVPPEFRRIWPGPTHVIAEDADGRVWQWGELALAGFLTKLMAPHPVDGVAGAVVSASSGNSFSVVVDDRGRAAAWGARDWKQLGVADAPSHGHAPVHPVLPAPIREVACGEAHVLAITADGHVLTWGSSMGGRLGTVAPLDVAPQPPTPVTHSVRDIVAVAAGHNHSLALADDGGLWGWGRDHRGQLGGAAGKGSPYPMRLPTAVPFTGIVAGKDFTLALDGDGTVWSWGRNDRGQLGLDGPPTRSGAGRVALPAPALRIFAGHSHAGAILVDGTLFLWGSNGHGELGVPGGARSFASRPRPMALPDGSWAADAGGGSGYTVCLTERGKILTWGQGFHGVDGSARRSGDSHVATPLAGEPRD